jgi:DNA mismatch endonuclease Vsr
LKKHKALDIWKVTQPNLCIKNEKRVLNYSAKANVIAKQTYHDTKAIVRAKFPTHIELNNFVFMDKLTKEQRRKNMQAVKSKGSKIEVLLAKALFARGYRYRKNDKSVFGKPDLTFKKIKLAVFVDSEFWHGKNWAKRKFDLKSNKKFWQNKIERNIQRDKQVNKVLKKSGWKVLRFWGMDIEETLEHCIIKIERVLNKK